MSDHEHGYYNLAGVAEEHHRHHDLESLADGLREDLGRAEERIRELEAGMTAVMAEIKVMKAGPAAENEAAVAEPCGHCGGSGRCDCRDSSCSDWGRTMTGGYRNPHMGECGYCHGTGGAR